MFQVKLFNEKREDLEEQQLHLNVGLQKIRETVDQVEELQKSLSIKRNELEEKNNAANVALKEMVSISCDVFELRTVSKLLIFRIYTLRSNIELLYSYLG